MKLSKQALIALGVASVGMMGCSEAEKPSADGTLARKQLDKMLEELAKNPVKSELRPGACCYMPISQPMRIEYLCPVCNAKTYHTKWENINDVQKANRYRQKIQHIKKLGVNAALDETDLCSQCRQDKSKDETSIYLNVTVDKRVIRTQLLHDDLDKLIAFFEKKDVWVSDNGATRSLKDEIPRIRQILGMEASEDKASK